jgi:small subunit ribosomal protein S8
MLNDTLSNALSKLLDYEKISRKECTVKSSKILKKVLEIMHNNGYVGSYEEIKSIRGNELKVNLIGAINNCGVIKPRFSVEAGNYTKFERRYLPAQDFGVLIVSTSLGIMTHDDAKKNRTGGKLIAFCY